jgi:thioredoxin-dependent peroxiredoxin
MLKVGTLAPDFDVEATDGTRLSMSSLRGKIVVLFFFPAAFTPGCSKETASFRDISPDLEQHGARIIGISTDDHKTQCDFASSTRATFPMIGDDDQRISKAYEVMWPIIGRAKRVTFVVDQGGRIAGVFHHEIHVGKHIDDVVDLVRRISGA